MKNYSTSDTLEAAFLWSQDGVSYVENTVTTVNKKTVVTFHFECNEKMDVAKLKNEFYNEVALVEPKRFMRKLNDVKSILFGVKRSN